MVPLRSTKGHLHYMSTQGYLIAVRTAAWEVKILRGSTKVYLHSQSQVHPRAT
jgi:hypothetical protein